jgi:hypothetical protein
MTKCGKASVLIASKSSYYSSIALCTTKKDSKVPLCSEQGLFQISLMGVGRAIASLRIVQYLLDVSSDAIPVSRYFGGLSQISKKLHSICKVRIKYKKSDCIVLLDKTNSPLKVRQI